MKESVSVISIVLGRIYNRLLQSLFKLFHIFHYFHTSSSYLFTFISAAIALKKKQDFMITNSYEAQRFLSSNNKYSEIV